MTRPNTFVVVISEVSMKELQKISDSNELLQAYKMASNGSDWKTSVQKYEANLLKNIRKTREDLRNNTYKQGEFLEFELNERGHNRRIKALGIADRVVQRSLCDNVMIPDLTKYLVYDNGASQKKKGVDFCRKRLETHLHRYYRKYGNDGYMLHIDFRKFFDNIRHDKLVEALQGKIDPDVLLVLEQMIYSFKVDISYSDEDLLNQVFNSLEYAKLPQQCKTGKRYMAKSMGIGSQISQVAGVFFPTRIDNYCKIVRGCKYYGRYMDDIYIIHNDKEFLRDVLRGIRVEADKIGLFINEKKTQIYKLSHGFSFLKIKYNLTGTGKIIKRPSRDNITRQRRKMKKFKRLVDTGQMTMKDARNEVRSWLGSMKKINAYKTSQNIRKLYKDLFGVDVYDTPSQGEPERVNTLIQLSKKVK